MKKIQPPQFRRRLLDSTFPNQNRHPEAWWNEVLAATDGYQHLVTADEVLYTQALFFVERRVEMEASPFEGMGKIECKKIDLKVLGIRFSEPK